MPSHSLKQQQLFARVENIKQGKEIRPPKRLKEIAKNMSLKKIKEFALTRINEDVSLLSRNEFLISYKEYIQN